MCWILKEGIISVNHQKYYKNVYLTCRRNYQRNNQNLILWNSQKCCKYLIKSYSKKWFHTSPQNLAIYQHLRAQQNKWVGVSKTLLKRDSNIEIDMQCCGHWYHIAVWTGKVITSCSSTITVTKHSWQNCWLRDVLFRKLL